MNICLISTGYPPEDGGGIGTYISNLAQGLKQEGHRVVVLTQTREEEKSEVVNGVDVRRFTSRYIPKLERLVPGLAWSRFIARQIDALDKEIGIDVVEFPNWEGVGFWYLLKKKRKPVVTRIHTPYFETLELDTKDGKISLGDRFICWMERQACQKSDKLVSSTVCHRQFIAENYDLSIKDIKIVPLGIKLVDQKDIQVVNEHNRLKVLYVSRLENRKGTITLVEAIPRILKKYQNVEFDFIGKDRPHAPGGITYKEYFMEKYPEYESSVHFLGFVSNEELFQYYRQTDLFVVPSVYESFGLIYVEAMMYAKAVIGCEAGGIPEVVDHNKTGLLTQPNDVDGLCEAVLKLIEDKELRLEMGRNARRHCEEKFSYEIMAKNMSNLYQETIENYGK